MKQAVRRIPLAAGCIIGTFACCRCTVADGLRRLEYARRSGQPLRAGAQRSTKDAGLLLKRVRLPTAPNKAYANGLP